MVEGTGEDMLQVFLCPVLKLWRRAKHQAQAHQPQVNSRPAPRQGTRNISEGLMKKGDLLECWLLGVKD
jgi:hypothetical protein